MSQQSGSGTGASKDAAANAAKSAKELAGGLFGRLKGTVKDHEAQIRGAVDKAEGFVDKQTKGKYHDKIAKAGSKADEAITKVAKDEPTTPGSGTPGT